MPTIYQGVHIQNEAVEPEKLIRNLRNYPPDGRRAEAPAGACSNS